MREIVERHRREPTYRPITIVQDATLAQVAAVTARRLDFELPDVVVEQVPTRRYPDDAGARICSATSARSTIAQVAEQRRAASSGDIVGQSGIEKIYNALLMGEDGASGVVVNSVGREIRTLEEEPPIEGKRLQLTIDDDVQRAVEDGFERLGFNGAAVVLDPSQRRGARVHQPAGLRSERVRRGHRPGDVGGAQHRRAAAAERPRDSGALLAGIDLQDGGGDGGARRRRDHAGLQGPLRRRRECSTAARSSAGRRAATARWTCGTPSSSRATCTSTRSAT